MVRVVEIGVSGLKLVSVRMGEGKHRVEYGENPLEIREWGNKDLAKEFHIQEVIEPDKVLENLKNGIG